MALFFSVLELNVLGRHEQELSAARHAVESLAAQMTDLNHRFQFLCHEQADPPSPSASSERVFFTQCEVFFSLQPSMYVADSARIVFVISLLTGRARDWEGKYCVFDYAIKFRTLSARYKWNEPALTARFLEGLNPDL